MSRPMAEPPTKKPTTTLRELTGNARAGHHELHNRNLPVVEGWKDFVHAPELTLALLERRLADGISPALAYRFPVPKPGKSEVRLLSCLHPLDELWFRILGGRVAPAIQRSVEPTEVLSYRLTQQPPEWRLENANQAFNERRVTAQRFLNDPHCEALGTLDIRQYYPTIVPQVVASALTSIDIPTNIVDALHQFLASLEEMGAPKGLPVDLATSGLLGRLLLRCADNIIRRRSLGFLRFSDDIWVFLWRASDWPALVAELESIVGEIGLTMNPEKTELHRKNLDDPLGVIRHNLIYDMTMGDRLRATVGEALDALLTEAKAAEPDFNLIRFALAVLRTNQCSDGLQILMEHPSIANAVPRNVGQYLRSLAASSRHRRAIDRDWLIERATESPTSQNCAMQVQSLRTLSMIHLDKSKGQQLDEIAMGTEQRPNPPIQAWAAYAWGKSEAFRPAGAVERTLGTGHYDVRRALVMAMHDCNWHPRRLHQACRKIRSVEPYLGPALSYVNS